MILLLCISLLGAVLCSAVEPLMDYDYSGYAVVQGGKFPAPVIYGETTISDGLPTALQLDGVKNYLTIPGGESFSLAKGGTLYAIVKFNPDKEYGMLFFKEKEFLLGFYRKNLYFNLPNGEPFEAPVYLGAIPVDCWCRIAAVVTVDNGDYSVRLHLDDKTSPPQVFRNLQYSKTEGKLTVGKGWGGVWYLHGQIAQLKVFDVPLTEAQISTLDQQSPYPFPR